MNPVTPPPEWFDLFLLLAAGAIFAFRLRGISASSQGSGRIGFVGCFVSVLRAIWGALWGFVKELGKLLQSLFRGRRRSRRRPGSSVAINDDRISRLVTVRSVAASHRWRIPRVPGRGCASGWAHSLVPRRRLNWRGGSKPPRPAIPAVGVLTGIYELARFSVQPLDESVVRQAARGAYRPSSVAGKSPDRR